MITQAKLDIFKHFNGDIDGWARASTPSQTSGITDKEWFLIESLIQDVRLVKSQSASGEYEKTLDAKLRANCDNDFTIKQLKDMA